MSQRRIILLRPRNGCSTWRSFSFKLFSVRWRVLRNNPFIKVICEDCDQGKNKETSPLCTRLLHSTLVLTYFLVPLLFSCSSNCCLRHFQYRFTVRRNHRPSKLNPLLLNRVFPRIKRNNASRKWIAIGPY